MNMIWKKDAPIIRSALETDVYKILMLFYHEADELPI